jgi:hypothetical protein
MAKGLALLLGKAAPPAPSSEEDVGDDDSDVSEEEEAAFAELKSALDSGDNTLGAQALKNFIRECS